MEPGIGTEPPGFNMRILAAIIFLGFSVGAFCQSTPYTHVSTAGALAAQAVGSTNRTATTDGATNVYDLFGMLYTYCPSCTDATNPAAPMEILIPASGVGRWKAVIKPPAGGWGTEQGGGNLFSVGTPVLPSIFQFTDTTGTNGGPLSVSAINPSASIVVADYFKTQVTVSTAAALSNAIIAATTTELSPGIIWIEPGTYNGFFDLNRQGAANLSLAARVPGTVTLSYTGSPAQGGVIAAAGNNSLINLTIAGSGANNFGVHTDDEGYSASMISAATVIYNCIISASGSAALGMEVKPNQRIIVANSVITSNDEGINFHNYTTSGDSAPGYGFFINNTVTSTGVGKSGIRVHNTGGVQPTLVHFDGGTYTGGSGGVGILYTNNGSSDVILIDIKTNVTATTAFSSTNLYSRGIYSVPQSRIARPIVGFWTVDGPFAANNTATFNSNSVFNEIATFTNDFVRAQGAVQVLNPGDTIDIDLGSSIRVLGNGGSQTLTSTPQIEAGSVGGQRITIWGTGVSDTVILTDSRTVAGSGVRFSMGGTRTFGRNLPGAEFFWHTTLNEWVEVGMDVSVFPSAVTFNGPVTFTNSIVYQQGAVQLVETNTTIDIDLGPMIRIAGLSTAKTLVSTPQIEAGSTGGRVITIFGTSISDTVTLTDSRVLAGSGVRLASGSTRAFGRDLPAASFFWHTTLSQWVEIGANLAQVRDNVNFNSNVVHTGTTTFNGNTTFTNHTIFAQGAVQTLSAGTTIDIDLGPSVRIIGNGGPITLTSTPQIEAGTTAGDRIVIWGTAVAETVTLTDDRVSAGSGVRLVSGSTRVFGRNLPPSQFVWMATLGVWQEIGAPEIGNVDGSGTTGRLSKFTGSTTIGNSIVSESGQVLTLNGGASTITNVSSSMTFGSATDLFLAPATGSTLSANADTDLTSIFGRARIHSASTDFATFSHFDRTASDQYAIRQSGPGGTDVNSAAGQPLRLRVGNADVAVLSGSNFGIGDTTPASLLTVGNGDLYEVNSSGSVVGLQGTDAGHYAGSGDPEGAQTAAVGSLYQRTSNGTLYQKTSGAGNTGWTLNGVGSGTVTGVAASAADVLGVSGSDITGDDAGFNSIVGWDNADNKLIHYAPSSAFDVDTTTDAFDLAPGGVQLDRIVDVDIQTILGGEGSIGPPQSLYLLHGLTNSAGFHSVALEAGTGITFATNVQTITISASASGGGYDTIEEEGTPLAQESTLNFIGSGITASAGTGKTDVTMDSDLDALASNSSNGLWARTGSGTGEARTITAGAGISVADGSGVAGNPTITNTGIATNSAVLTKVLVDEVSTGVITVNLPDEGRAGVVLDIQVEAEDGTDFQSAVNTVFLTGVNKGGTISKTGGGIVAWTVAAVSAGSLIITDTVTDDGTSITYEVNANTSLAGATITARVQVRNLGGQTITVP